MEDPLLKHNGSFTQYVMTEQSNTNPELHFPTDQEIADNYTSHIESIVNIILESLNEDRLTRTKIWWEVLFTFWQRVREIVDPQFSIPIIKHETMRKKWLEVRARAERIMKAHVSAAASHLDKHLRLPWHVVNDINYHFRELGHAFCSGCVTDNMIFPDFKSAHMTQNGEWNGNHIKYSFIKKEEIIGDYDSEKAAMIIIPKLVRAPLSRIHRGYETQRNIFSVSSANKTPLSPEKYICC